MNPAVIITGYVRWHYYKAFSDIFSIWTNILWFIIHFFSIPMLLRTLFSPWKRVRETYHLRTGFEDFFESLVVNIMTRIIGAVMRLVIIAVGLVSLIVMLLGIIAALLFWIIAPLALALLVAVGISLII